MKKETKERQEADFIEQGKARLRSCLEDYLEKFKDTKLPGEVDVDAFLQGYEFFASSSVPGGYWRRKFGREEIIPLSLLLSVDWAKLIDYTLAKPELDYLLYLAYRAFVWDVGFYVPKISRYNNLRHEALLDTDLERALDGAQEDIPRETRLRGFLSKYLRALQIAWQEGWKYGELLELPPGEYGLPEFGDEDIEDIEEGEHILPQSREDAVLALLGVVHYLAEKGRNLNYPSLRRIAEVEGIPYSKILRAYDITREALIKQKLWEEKCIKENNKEKQ